MRRRTLLTVAAVTLTLGLLALAPGFGPVRDTLLRRVTGLLAANGLEVTYDASSGNAWRGVALEGVNIRGRGADVRAERLELGYFLPSLLGGELPLDVVLDQASGTLDLAGLLPEDGGNGAIGPSLRVLPREIDLKNVDVRVVQVPFELPDLSIEGVRVEEEPGALRFSASVATAEGSGEVTGRYDLLSGVVALSIPRADTTLARHWWEGAVAGTASGSLRIDGQRIEGDFELDGGAIDAAGLQVRDVSGTVLLRYPVLVADVSGLALGGPVHATGTVNVANRHYDVNGTAAPTLADATAWLTRDAAPDGLPFDVTGDADVELRVTGWNAPVIEGRATAAGAAAGLPLENLDARFTLTTSAPPTGPENGGVAADTRRSTSIRLDASAMYGGGPLRASVAPAREGDHLEVRASSVDLVGLEVGGFRLEAPGGAAAEAGDDGPPAADAGARDAGAGADAGEGSPDAPGGSASERPALAARIADLSLDLDLGGGPAGSLVAELQGTLPVAPDVITPFTVAPDAPRAGSLETSAPFSLTLDGSLDADGWRAFARGTAADLPFEGAFVLADTRVDGAVNVPQVRLPGVRDPVRATLSATGPLDALVVGLALDADDAIVLDTPGVFIDADLRGAASGSLEVGAPSTDGAQGERRAAIRDVSGVFGPVSLAGEVSLSPFAIDFGVALDTTQVALAGGTEPGAALEAQAADARASVEGSLTDATFFADAGVPEGRLTYAYGRLAWRGRALVTDVALGPVGVEVEALDTRFELPSGGAPGVEAEATPGAERWLLTAAAPDERLTLRVEGGRGSPTIDATLLALPVGLRDEPDARVIAETTRATVAAVALMGAGDEPTDDAIAGTAADRLLISGTVTSRVEPATTLDTPTTPAPTLDTSASPAPSLDTPITPAPTLDTSASPSRSTTPRFDVDLRAAPGDVGGLTLTHGANVSGIVDVGAASANLALAVGTVEATLDASWSQGAFAASGALLTPRPDPAAGPATLDYAVAPTRGAWSVAGEAELGALAAELGLGEGVQGTFAGALAHGQTAATPEDGGDDAAVGDGDGLADDGYAGDATIRLGAPIALDATLRGAGEAIVVSVDGDVAGLPLTGSGSITGVAWREGAAGAAAADSGPAVVLIADLGPLTGVRLDLSGARGSGVLDGVTAGPIEVARVPWSLEADWRSTSATLTVAGAPLSVTLAGGEAEVAGALTLPFRYAGDPYLLRAGPEDGARRTADLASLPLRGWVMADDGADEAAGPDLVTAPDPERALATIEGTPRELRLQLLDEEGALSAALPASLRPAARIEATATADLLAGPSYRAEFQVTSEAGTELLRGEANGLGAELRLEARGEGLEIAYDVQPQAPAGVLRVLANEAPLEGLAAAVPAIAAVGGPQEGMATGAWFATLDGAMTHDAAAGWRGALHVDAGTNADALAATGRLTVVGEGDRLAVQGGLEAYGGAAAVSAESGRDALPGAAPDAGPEGAPPTAHVDVSGTVLPRLVLEGDIGAMGDAVRGAYRFTGEDGLVADVSVASFTSDLVSTDPLQATLRWQADEDEIALTGDGIDARVSLGAAEAGRIDGGATLPLTVLGRATAARVSLSGTLAEPVVRADVSADVHQASAAAPFLAGPVEATATWAGQDGWSAEAAVMLTAPDAPLRLSARADGTGATYTGALSLAGPAVDGARSPVVAEAPLSGTGAAAHVTLDLATVNWRALGRSLGVELDLSGDGAVTFDTRPLAATFRADLTGTVAGADFRLTGTAPDDLRLVLDGAVGQLDGRLAWTEERTAELRGVLDGRTVDVTLEVGDDFQSGRLVAAIGEATLRADLSSAAASTAASTAVEPSTEDQPMPPEGSTASAAAGTARVLEVTADVPRGVFGRPGGAARAVVVFATAPAQDAGPTFATLRSFDARLTGLLEPGGEGGGEGTGDMPILLDAEGPLGPELGVRGHVRVPALGEAADFDVRGAPAVVELRWDGLRATFDSATTAVTLNGGTTVDAGGPYAAAYEALLPTFLHGAGLDLESTSLTWNPSDGFGGTANAAVTAPAWERLGDLAVSLGGEGELVIDAGMTMASSASPWVGVSARLAPDPRQDRRLRGNVILDAPLTAFLDAGDGPDVRLTGRPEIGGTLGAPTLAGGIALVGAATADGEVVFEGTAARLALTGPQLTVDADWEAGSWQAQAGLEELDLTPWAPFLAEPRLSLAARAGSSEAGASVVHVEDIALVSNRSSLTGGATVGNGVRAALQAQVDLADLRLGGTELRGLLRGPMVLTAPSFAELPNASVTALLDAAGVGVASIDGSVSGSLQLGGSVAEPFITTALVGDGAIAGAVRLAVAPAEGRFDLTSDLRFGSFASDLRLAVQPGAVTARGAARLGEAVIVFDDDEDGIIASGVGRLDGWSARIASDLSAADVTGDLATAARGAHGAVSLAFRSADRRTAAETEGGEATTPWLSGVVTGAALLDQPLGTLRLDSAGPGAVVTIRGDHVRASLDPRSLRWSVDLEDFPTTLGPTVDLRGDGTSAAFSVEGTAASAANEGALPVDLTFAYQRGPSTEIRVRGDVADGTIEAFATRQGSAAWQGGARLHDVRLGGFTMDADGAAQGTALLPQLVLRTSAMGAISATGRATVGISGATIDQTIEGGPLSAPLRVQGRVLPHTDLVIVGAAGAPAVPARPGAADGATAGAATEGAVSGFGSSGTFRLRGDGTASGALHAVGSVEAALGPVRMRLEGRGVNGTPYLRAGIPALPGLGLEANLSASSLADLVRRIALGGLALDGTGTASGRVTLRAAPELVVSIESVRAEALGFLITADGTVDARGADVRGVLALPAGLPVEDVLPWQVTREDGRWRLLSDGDLGTIEAAFDEDGGLTLDVDAGIGGGRVEGKATLVPGVGLDGSLVVSSVHVAPTGLGIMVLEADATIADGRVGGRASVDVAGGRLSASGSWGLGEVLPATLVPGAPRGGNVELRARTVALSQLPAVHDLLPHLRGAISGVVQVRDGLILGQVLAPELRVGERTLPTTLSVSGSLTELDASLRVGRSLLTADFDGSAISGTARLEVLPLDLLAEAAVGETDVTAEVTGVLRFELPIAAPASGYARIASEEIRLERAGVVTMGDVTITYSDRAVSVDRAEFQGLGAWEAGGVIGPDALDFRLEAIDADFTPLLGLVPSLARLGVGARGSFTLTAGGSLATPTARFDSERLDVRVAGGEYRLAGTQVGLEGVALRGETSLTASGAVTGALDVTADARLVLLPLAIDDLDVRFDGEAGVRNVGTVTNVEGVIRQQNGAPWLELGGELGSPLRVEGSLAPLDLRAGGTDLTLAFPSLLVASAVVDAGLNLTAEPAGLTLGGVILADEVVIDPAARAAAEQGAEPAEPQDALAGSAAGTDAVNGETTSEPGATDGVHFASLEIRAPQRVLLSTNLGSGEAALDLVLSGTSKRPQLSGEASALRGNLRFSGRDFTIERAVATFRPNRGVLPDLDVAAYAEFDKQRSLSGLPDVRFVEPSAGATFRVDLAFAGPVESAPPEQGSFRFDVQPVLRSEALIEVPGEGVGAGVRPLTQPELLSLLTLGRLELNADVIGSGGLGEAVAQGAIDTAVDLLIVSELQDALREALGLDVVEIRTSTLSSLLDVGAQPFGVSVRLGGYLVPELFASYRIGTYDGTDRAYAVTNEVMLSYGLGPLDLDLFGRLDFPTAGTLAAPRPELGVGVSYAFGRSLRLQTGVSLANDRSAVRFGVTLRW